MHNNYYASGFLYNSVTEKILLQSSPDGQYSHTLFSKKCLRNENSISIFQQTIQESLGISIPQQFIQQVYEYVLEDANEKHTIFYADISKMGDVTFPEKNGTNEWFSTKELTKLKLQPQTKHDIMIGQRVIRAEYTPE
jgi:hypothetical protein